MRIAVPSKGRLKDITINLLEEAGLAPVYKDARALIVPSLKEGIEIVYARPEDIPWIVSSGAAELGITGHDYVLEAEVNVKELVDLGYGKSRLVLAVPEKSGIEKPEELPEGIRIATKFVNLAKRYMTEKGIKGKIVRISGSAEVMPGIGAADAIIDISSTGTTLKLHGLKPIDTILKSSARLIANENVVNNNNVQEVKLMIESVIRARKKKLIMMNVPKDKLESVINVLPSMSGPTISEVEGPEPLMEVIVAVDEEDVPRVIVKAKELGAKDILVLNIERIIP